MGQEGDLRMYVAYTIRVHTHTVNAEACCSMSSSIAVASPARQQAWSAARGQLFGSCHHE